MKIGKNVFIADNATLAGDVAIGDNSAIFFGAVLRGDQNSIDVGKFTNVQDNVVIHADEEHDTKIGDYVSIGHGAIVHGARVESYALIGMGSILMSGSVVEEQAVIGAGAIVTSGTVVNRNCLAVGSPAKILRCDYSIGEMARKNSEIYMNLKIKHHEGKFPTYSR